ncbi:hypothetical protein Ctob_011179 [Chrysochromulina tobinii]|uniref:Uncharacterized protein n=1 Tax=Chrysochromulina tobinii TaxID=1460289 RepID=A0A0M0K8Q9_9EUKA|nr:hypothetical protein Ctob_011179 [Chrysochromulina tobinii]|eukprot:KOO34957.1 hypothetical protein Ctob_011179 [Chrysochromulina sp. CCMP291]
MMGLPPSDMCQAATTKIQAIFRAAMQRRTVSEAAATVAIVVTEGFGDLIGRNDIRHVLNDLQMQKRRLEEKIETLEQSMYYAKATRQKEIRNVTKLGRKKKRELEDELVVDVKQRYEDGATKRRQQVDGVSGSRRKTRVRGDTLDEVEGGALRVLEKELLEEERYQGIAKVYDSLDADASNRSLDAVRATYVHAVMNTEDHGQMQHHLARSLLLDIRLPWYQVCAADVRVAKNLLAKVMLQRKMASAVAHSLRMGKEQGSRRKQASNAEKLEALMHYAAMLDYMKDLLAGKLRKMRFALIRRAIRACVERRREDLSRPECIRAATIIQKYYRTYRVRRLLDLCAALQQQDRDLKARLEHQRQVRQRLGKGFQRSVSTMQIIDTSKSACAIMIQRQMRFIWEMREIEVEAAKQLEMSQRIQRQYRSNRAHMRKRQQQQRLEARDAAYMAELAVHQREVKAKRKRARVLASPSRTARKLLRLATKLGVHLDPSQPADTLEESSSGSTVLSSSARSRAMGTGTGAHATATRKLASLWMDGGMRAARAKLDRASLARWRAQHAAYARGHGLRRELVGALREAQAQRERRAEREANEKAHRMRLWKLEDEAAFAIQGAWRGLITRRDEAVQNKVLKTVVLLRQRVARSMDASHQISEKERVARQARLRRTRARSSARLANSPEGREKAAREAEAEALQAERVAQAKLDAQFEWTRGKGLEEVGQALGTGLGALIESLNMHGGQFGAPAPSATASTDDAKTSVASSSSAQPRDAASPASRRLPPSRYPSRVSPSLLQGTAASNRRVKH